ncbi:hypothetical protein N7U66_13300 [Lacinutrix neustonica]|uniref:Outer membrane protein beta-barrel domain-containing protein n=1 Tax=Lacinutrix neustonica TaxID=2980107 RepID=A0A9E8SCL3_9FLAO|nr:hypothetical protein [Lacinutrix neustonica]WAC01131.1 hypothetical protein N7U66_13300 [Lacinutrix neustonica]
MSEKKHIDRLFQEKFKDFEAKPKDTVWNAIQNQLEPAAVQPKVMPLWLRLAGVAALVVLLFTIGNTFLESNTSEGNTETIVDTKVDTNGNPENTNSASKTNNTASTENETVSEKKPENNALNRNTTTNVPTTQGSNPIVNTNTTTSGNTNKTSTNSIITKKETQANALSASEPLQKNAKTLSNDTTSESKEVSTAVTNVIDKKTGSQNADRNTAAKTTNKANRSSQDTKASPSYNAIANNKTSQNASEKYAKSTSNLPLYTQNKTANNERLNSNGIADNTEKLEENQTNQNIINNKTKAKTSKEALAQTNSEEEKTNLNPVDEDAQTPNLLEEAALANNIEDAIEKEEEKEEETVMNRWTVNANVAPVYYNTLGKGSPIHDQFIDNPKNGEINTSYGIHLGYALNNRLKVRSGISKLNLSYDTANVIIYENVSNTPNSAPLRNINFVPTNQGQSIGVLSANNLSIQQIDGVTNDALNAALSQRLSYLEVPVELEYAIINKRVGFNVIGGVSTFILEGNEVVTEVENRKTTIGEANNINNVSFTTNIGLGLDYKFSDTFKFNFEPTFKYQVNAYNETSVILSLTSLAFILVLVINFKF